MWFYINIPIFQYFYKVVNIISNMKKNMKKLIVDIPDEIHQALKLKAVKEHTTIKEIVTKALEQFK